MLAVGCVIGTKAVLDGNGNIRVQVANTVACFTVSSDAEAIGKFVKLANSRYPAPDYDQNGWNVGELIFENGVPLALREIDAPLTGATVQL